MLDLSQLTDTDLVALKARLDDMTSNGRSKALPGRQLHDLTLLPTATDPRPLFLPSAESPRNAPPQRPEFKKLLWHGETNQEITVHSPAEEQKKLAEGYVTQSAEQRALSPEELLAMEFAQLSPDDQRLALEMTANAKRQALQDKLAALSDSALERMAAAAAKMGKGKALKRA